MILATVRNFGLVLLFCVAPSPRAAAQGAGGAAADGPAPFDGLVEVGGGRRLRLRCSGASPAGGPTVVLESGAGNDSTAWDRVQPEVAKFARVCAYDRAGLGGSDPVPAPRSIVAVTEDLRALLRNAKAAGPYVLVGHSLGGILARLYASYYPAEVAGMVLVESAHEDEADRALRLIPRETYKEMLKRLGPADLIPQLGEPIDSCSIRPLMNALDWRADVPLVVLTQGRPYGPDMVAVPSTAPQAYRLHLELQRDLARRSPGGRHVIARKSGHAVHRDEPGLVVEAVRRVFDEVRGGRRRRRI
jgi:pimeloyl-ACP methyl ester carboxylesterase